MITSAAQHLIEVDRHFMDGIERSLAEFEQLRAAGGVNMLAELLQRDVRESS